MTMRTCPRVSVKRTIASHRARPPRDVGARPLPRHHRYVHYFASTNAAPLAACGSARMEAVSLELGRSVRTEFVYADGATHGCVALCGDWTTWAPLPMTREASATPVWSVITIVPAGYREFCYVVDGQRTLSRRHPTTTDGSANWRTVHGPPPPPLSLRRPWFRFADATALRLRAAILRVTTNSSYTLPSFDSRAKSRSRLEFSPFFLAVTLLAASMALVYWRHRVQ